MNPNRRHQDGPFNEKRVMISIGTTKLEDQRSYWERHMVEILYDIVTVDVVRVQESGRQLRSALPGFVG